MTTTPRLGITQLEEDQALPEAVVNGGVLFLEMFATRLCVKSKGDTSPPGSPANGDAYLLGSSATGAWSGQDEKLALYINGAWEFVTAKDGFEVEVEDEDTSYVLRGASWVNQAGASIAVEDEGVQETASLVSLNFIGAGVTASDDGSGNVDVTIPGGIGTYRGALVYNNAAINTLNTSNGLVIPWSQEDYDTDSFHPLSATVTITIASPGVVTWTGHTLINGEPITLSTTGALPTGLSAGTTYWVVNSAANTFQLASTPGGTAINTTGSQSGTHTANAIGRLVVPSGVSKVKLTFCVEASNVTAGSDCFVQIKKNATDLTIGGAWETADLASSTLPRVTASSAVVSVSAGDHFGVFWTTSGDNSTTIGTASWFAIEVKE